MDPKFKARYADHGRNLKFMGFSVESMKHDELYAVIGFLLERAGEASRMELMQEAPLGAPHSDPPQNDGLLEG